jgi:hypothetical protein
MKLAMEDPMAKIVEFGPNPKGLALTGIVDYVTWYGVQDGASGKAAETTWMINIGDVQLTTTNRKYSEIFRLAIEKNLKVAIGYTTDSKIVFMARIHIT